MPANITGDGNIADKWENSNPLGIQTDGDTRWNLTVYSIEPSIELRKLCWWINSISLYKFLISGRLISGRYTVSN